MATGWRLGGHAISFDDDPAMGFNRRKMEAQRAAAAEKEAAAKRATEAQILEDAGRLVAAWNERQAKRMPMLFSPTIGCALKAKHQFLWVRCPACLTTVGTQSCRMGLFSLQDIVNHSLYTLAWHQIGPVRYLPMNTSETNAVSLTPISTIVHPRFYAAVLRYRLEVGHSRSQPAGLESTFNPASAKPVAPTEKPLELTGITPALEPAREPVPGAIPG